MKTKFTLLIICLLLSACNAYIPFSSVDDKKASIRLIKNKIELTSKEYNAIKKEDSILYSVSNAIKGNVRTSLIERRIDSFLLKSYNKKELCAVLRLDSLFPNQKIPFELDRRKGKKRLELNNVKELKDFMNGGFKKKLDSVIPMKHKDSTKKKKH